MSDRLLASRPAKNRFVHDVEAVEKFPKSTFSGAFEHLADYAELEASRKTGEIATAAVRDNDANSPRR